MARKPTPAPKANVCHFGGMRPGEPEGAFISVAGMIAELERFGCPPHLFNEGAVGFETAIYHVIRYLRARAK